MEHRQTDEELTNDEVMRYSRQLLMKDIGVEGQKKLKAAKVLIIGAGGLGSPAGLYLAGAGIGTIGLVDGDVVEESNLHRQVIHNERNIGKLKTVSAKESILAFNHHVKVVTYETRFTKENAREILEGWDIVMDGSDNAPTRYLINDICMIRDTLGTERISVYQGLDFDRSTKFYAAPVKFNELDSSRLVSAVGGIDLQPKVHDPIRRAMKGKMHAHLDQRQVPELSVCTRRNLPLTPQYQFCMILKKPLVSGSALQLEGQITVYGLRGGPCYRCMFPEPPPAHTVTNCSDGGVLGMVPGLIGNLQSIEIVKIILGFPDDQVLNRRMIFFDASNMKFRNVKLRDRNPACAVCGDSPTVTDVTQFDYESFCQTNCNRYALIKILPENNITVQDFAPVYKESILPNKGDTILIDVRPALQYDIVKLEGSHSFPLAALKKDPSAMLKLAEGKEKIFVMCRRGNASKDATEFLINNCNITNVVNVQGGITEYINKVDPSLPLY